MRQFSGNRTPRLEQVLQIMDEMTPDELRGLWELGQGIMLDANEGWPKGTHASGVPPQS